MTHPVSVRLRTRSELPSASDPILAESMPLTGPLVDSHGRVHDDLRISVTDRCNLRCTYCIPEEGIDFLPRSEILTFEEIARIAGVARALGIERVRLSGGEPLMRRDLPRLVSLVSSQGFSDCAMTTNGMLLARHASALIDAGLTRVNVSCDSLDPIRFAEIRRNGELARVLDAMDAAESAGFPPVKINVVLVRGINDDEVEAFAAFGRSTGRTVRFIEFMPLDGPGEWSAGAVVPGTEVVARIAARWDVEAVSDPSDPHAPADTYRYRDGNGDFGVIASVTQPFCGTCNRLRITADGSVRNCLFSTTESSARDLLRSGAGDADIALLVRRAVWGKLPGHAINDPGFLRPRRSMSMIGG